MGTLYLVATPIGNLEDISSRAIRILNESVLIAAEDTRTTGKLAAHFGIHTPLTAYHEHNKLRRIESILSALASGDVALVSDAGTPGLNDPGFELVRAVLAAGFDVSPIPGASAPLAALVASGLPTDSFLYIGYLPRKTSERKTVLRALAELKPTIVALEAPHRLVESLEDVLDVFGDRPMAVARELTKVHEEIHRGTVSSALDRFRATPPLGEITLVVGGTGEAPRWPETRLLTEIRRGQAKQISAAAAAAELAVKSGWPRREVYRLILASTKSAKTRKTTDRK